MSDLERLLFKMAIDAKLIPVQSRWNPQRIRSRHQHYLEEARTVLPNMARKEGFIAAALGNQLSYDIFVSSTLFTRLKRTTIKKLSVNFSNVGSYLLLRILEETYFDLISFMTVVEDHEGNVQRLSIYNYIGDDHTKFLDLFSVGSVIILKEPYYKVAKDDLEMLRCDCPTDIIILSQSNSLHHLSEGIEWKNELSTSTGPSAYEGNAVPKSAVTWKDCGNYFFKRKQFNKSIDAYLMGMKFCDETDSMWKLLRMNLAAAYLEVEDFEEAVSNCQKVLEKFSSEQKALFRAAIANYKLRNYKMALFYFEQLIAAHPNFAEAHKQLKLAKMRVEESTSGAFDKQRLQRESSKFPKNLIDCADYIGPIKVTRDMVQVVATENVEPGAILAVSKALAFSFIPSKCTLGEVGSSLISKLIIKLTIVAMKNPNSYVATKLFTLPPSDGSVKANKLFCDSHTKSEPIVNVKLIKDICIANISEVIVAHEPIGIGVYDLNIQRGTNPNVESVFYNDVMFIHATRPIKRNQQLCLPLVLTRMQAHRNRYCY